MLKLNDREGNLYNIPGYKIAWDGCHKIYVVATDIDQEEAVSLNYDLYELEQLPKIWEESCPLKFISPWDLHTNYIQQGDMAYATLVFKDDYNDILITTNYNEYKGDLEDE